MKVIFLDIDGVLNRIGPDPEKRTKTRWNGFIGMEPELVDRFNQLCERTDAKVVLSSTWRLDNDWRETMKANGLTCEFLDRTPSLTGEQTSQGRGEEIRVWLNEFNKWNPEVIEEYCCIDDDADFLPGQHLFKTDYAKGLDEKMVELIVKYFSDDKAIIPS